MKKFLIIICNLIMLLNTNLVLSNTRKNIKRLNMNNITNTSSTKLNDEETTIQILDADDITKEFNEENILIVKKEVEDKILDVKSKCSGIKKDFDSIFGLSIATTVSSGLGTLAGGGALVTGLIKTKVDKEEEEEKVLAKMIENLAEIRSNKDVNDTTVTEEETALLNKIEEESNKIYEDLSNKINTDTESNNSKLLGNIRSGLIGGATLTSAVSTGTSIGSTITAKKLVDKINDCNNSLKELQLANGKLEVEGEKNERANEILTFCKGYDNSNINILKNLSTANSVVSGIGTLTGGAGTITSILANSKKIREDDSETGVQKEKNLNLASNILSGITTGTSLASTTLSATQISNAKKDSEMAEKCEKVLEK